MYIVKKGKLDGGNIGKNKGKLAVHSAVSFFAVAFILFLLFGCVSTEQCPPQPDWVADPGQEGYYVGVGSADSGNKAEDRSVAEARARADLASRISATIRSELEVESEATSSGESSQRVTEDLTQSVQANLKDVETVNAYHCPSEGYWVYVRLSKKRWNEIQERRRADLEQRLQKLVEPVIESEKSSFLLYVETFLKGRRLVYESPLGTTATGSLAGKSGNLNDILTGKVNEVFQSLDMKVGKDSITLSVGESAEMKGKLSSSLYPQTGNVEILVGEKNEQPLTSTQTKKDGSFTVRVPDGFEKPGEHHVVLRPVFEQFEREGVLSKEALPEREVVFSVERAPVALKMESPAHVDSDYSKEVKSLFTDRELPIEFVNAAGDEGEAQLLINFTLNIRDMPENEDLQGLLFSKAKAVVEFIRDGRSIYSYETDMLKGPGLNRNQARSKAMDKLFSSLKENDEMFAELETAILTR